ncbi:MAG: hypothetical protein ACE5JI_04195 [Acidobacteriota bacterium]
MIRRLSTVAGMTILSLAAGWLVLESGSRGFLAFDQSILFDGGYRVYLGQVPFRDFYIPTGPVPFWMQAAFFALFSVSYETYLFHAAVVNALAALLACQWIRVLYPEARLHAYLGGAVTAVWFYPPFGTPWFEQTAFFFHLLASVLLYKGLRRELQSAVASLGGPGRHTLVLIVAAGFIAGLSFLSKQNAGLLSVACCLGVVLVGTPLSWNRRRLLAATFLAGLSASALLFGTWLYLFSHPGHFQEFFFEIPSAEGWRRLGDNWLVDFVSDELSVSSPNRAASLLAFIIAVGGLSSHLWHRYRNRAPLLGGTQILTATTIASLFLLQGMFIHLTVNQAENGFAFCGVMVALAMLLVEDLMRPLLRRPGNDPIVLRSAVVLRTSYFLLASVVAVTLIRQGWNVSWSRQVHDIFWRSRFDDEVIAQALYPVRWAIPTPAARRSGEQINAREIDDLTRFLGAVDGNFFIFPDYTILYGLTGKTPPQPLVWFHRGLTYPREQWAWLDHRLVRDLHQHAVDHVVLEEVSLDGTRKRLSDFPSLQRYIRSQFELIEKIGIFQIYRRKGAAKTDS